MLGEREGRYRYYCPLLGMVFEQTKEDIIWANSSGELKNWSINFDCDTDFFDLDVESESHVFIIGDPIESLKQEVDASLKIKEAYEAREQSVSWHTPDAIFTKGRHLFLNGVPVLQNDIVWFRCDPANTVHYYELLRRLCAVDAYILNSPQAILNFHDKLSTSSLTNTCQYTVSNEANVSRCYKHLTTAGHEKFIVKAPSRFGGQSVYKVENLDELMAAFHDNIDDSGYVIVQGFIEMEKPTDTRVLITPYKIIGVFDRVAKDGDFICNMAAGRTAEASKKLSDKQFSYVKQTQSLMLDNDIFLAGIDLLGDELIEINVSCPGGIIYINEVSNDTVEFDIIDAAQDWVKRKKTSFWRVPSFL